MILDKIDISGAGIEKKIEQNRMILSIFIDINVISLCLIGLSSDGSPGLQEGPKNIFSPEMYSPLVAHSQPTLKKLNYNFFSDLPCKF